MRLVALRTGPWTIEHWTPFGELSPDEAFSPGYRQGAVGADGGVGHG